MPATDIGRVAATPVGSRTLSESRVGRQRQWPFGWSLMPRGVIAVFTDTDFPPVVNTCQGCLMSRSYPSLSRHRLRLM